MSSVFDNVRIQLSNMFDEIHLLDIIFQFLANYFTATDELICNTIIDLKFLWCNILNGNDKNSKLDKSTMSLNTKTFTITSIHKRGYFDMMRNDGKFYCNIIRDNFREMMILNF